MIARQPRWRDLGLYVVLVANLALVGIAFDAILAAPRDNVLYPDYDGGKNYFTPYSYVSGLGVDPGHHHPLKVYGQHYPFGEYVFYTDNTPLVSLPMRGLHALGVDMPAGGVAGLSLVFLLLTWSTAPVLYAFLRDLDVARWTGVAFSLILTYVNKQIWHLSLGSPNLGLTVLTVLVLWAMLRLWRSPDSTKLWGLVAVHIGLCGWLHLYYLIVYGTAVGLFTCALAWKAWPASRYVALRGLACLAVAAALVAVPLWLTDGDLGRRPATDLGFGYEAWRIDLRSLVTPPPGIKSRFIVSGREEVYGEPSGYLGLWFLYAVLALTVSVAFYGPARKWLWPATDTGRFVAVLSGVGGFCFFASLGIQYFEPDSEYVWQVVLNPFYPFVKAVPVLSQFRATARFFFVTHLAWGVALVYLIDKLRSAAARRSRTTRHIALAGLVGIVLLGFVDVRDYLRARSREKFVNPTGLAATAPYASGLASLALADYQALLIAPYYHVGSEIPGLVADPDHQLERQAWTLAAATRLPLVNAVTSRTAPYQSRQLFAFATRGVASDSLAALMDQRPILLAVHEPSRERIANGGEGYPLPPEGIARTAAVSSLDLPSATGVAYLTSVGEFHFYRMPLRRRSD